MHKLNWYDFVVLALAWISMGLTFGCWIRGITYYCYEDTGRACFWMLAGLVVDKFLGWFSASIMSYGSKHFADFIQGTDKKEE